VAAATTSSDLKTHLTAGTDFLKRGLLDDAEREFRLALETDANNLDAIAGLGEVEAARGHYSQALPHLERATRVSPQMVSAFRSLGDAYAATGDLTRAATAYRQAVALSPTDVGMRLSLARSLTQIGEYAEARSVCTEAIRLSKGNPADMARSYARLAHAYSGEGKTPEAMASAYKAAELAPRDVEVARAVAECAVRGGLYAEAAMAYGKVLQLSPLDVNAKKQLAWVNFKLERYPVAIKNYEAIGDSLGTVDRYYLAQAYAKSNKVDRAVELYREVVNTDPQNYRGVYCNMANAYYDASRYQRAIEVVREGLAGDSASACLKYCWAQALDKLGRHEEAITMFESVQDDPAYADAAKRELERQRRIVRLLKTKERGGNQ
jgi:tetratricopeptide (TPR) repeat protein